MNKTGTSLYKQSPKFSAEKLETTYIESLEEIVKLLAGMVTLLCDDGITYSIIA